MNLTRRNWLLGGVAAFAAHAQEHMPQRRLILDASRALQAGNAARFLGYFDRKSFDDFGSLERSVAALLEARTVASSVDVLSLKEADGAWLAEVDWLLQLTAVSATGPIERRSETVRLTVASDKKNRWRITAFEPLELFRIL